MKLGIDWQSIIFYVVNFGILYAVLAKYLVPPVLNMLDKRKEMVEGSINEANKLKADFQEKTLQMEREKAATQATMAKEMENLTKDIPKE